MILSVFQQKKKPDSVDIIGLLDDCMHFSHEFFTILNISSLQVYHSALTFTPRQSKLWNTYKDKQWFTLNLHNAVPGTWSPCMRVIDGHSDSVFSVAFSPDGTCIVSGSKDNTLQLWDAVSGAHLNTLKGHSKYVSSVAFSPDGTHIVSGSCDTTFSCGMQQVVPILIHSRDILTGFVLLHSPPMADI